jgi:hypothetical protein
MRYLAVNLKSKNRHLPDLPRTLHIFYTTVTSVDNSTYIAFSTLRYVTYVLVLYEDMESWRVWKLRHLVFFLEELKVIYRTLLYIQHIIIIRRFILSQARACVSSWE